MEGRLVITGRTELEEEYLAKLIAQGLHGADPIVRVKAVLCYPVQHAILWPSEAHENAPVDPGTVCRLPFLRDASPEEAGLVCRARECFLNAWERRLSGARPEEREILLRQKEGRRAQRRSLLTFTPSEIAHIRRNTK